MPRRNVYLPKDLDEYVTEHNISLSALLQEALRERIAKSKSPRRVVTPYRSGGVQRGWGGITRGRDE